MDEGLVYELIELKDGGPLDGSVVQVPRGTVSLFASAGPQALKPLISLGPRPSHVYRRVHPTLFADYPEFQYGGCK